MSELVGKGYSTTRIEMVVAAELPTSGELNVGGKIQKYNIGDFLVRSKYTNEQYVVGKDIFNRDFRPVFDSEDIRNKIKLESKVQKRNYKIKNIEKFLPMLKKKAMVV